MRGAPDRSSRRRAGAVLLADHHRTARDRARQALAGAGHDVRSVAAGDRALLAARRAAFDVAVLEVGLPVVHGYGVCQGLRERFGGRIGIMLVSAERTEPFDRAGGLLLGADDYLVKPFPEEELLARVEHLLEHAHAAGTAGTSALTPREREVLLLVADGLSTRQIARRLVVSPRTVATHVDHVLAKLGARTRAHAVAEACRAGVLDLRTRTGGPAAGEAPGSTRSARHHLCS